MSDDEFLAAFEACSLEDFHHRDHIKIAYLYLQRHAFSDAVVKVRSGLQALAEEWGAPKEELEKGYHETMTRAWVVLVHFRMNSGGANWDSETFCERHPELMVKAYIERFYSRERLFSRQAKREFIEPDIARLS